nr:D-alanyl-D-alanine carboxypeptidase/D-alanyl-D-alanine-endopeptidase [Micromonospora sp. DSM 115978]
MGSEDSHSGPMSGSSTGPPHRGRAGVPDPYPVPGSSGGPGSTSPDRSDPAGPARGRAAVPPASWPPPPQADRPAARTASASGGAGEPGPTAPARAVVPAARPAQPTGPDPAGPAQPAARRRGRAVRIALPLLLVLVVLLGLAGVAVVRPGPVAGWFGAEPLSSTAPPQAPESPPPPVLAAAEATAPLPVPAELRSVLDPLVNAAVLGDRVNVSVLDVATRQSLYANDGNRPTVPASTTKLITAVAVLAARGPAYRIATRAVAGERPGEVVLVGGGDPTLAINGTAFYAGAGRLDRLADQVTAALGGTAPTRVTVDASLYSGPVYEPGWDDDIPTGGFGAPITALMTDGARLDPKTKAKGPARSPNPDLAAGRSFAKALGLPASAVRRGTAPPASSPPASSPPAGSPPASTSATAVAPGTELGTVESPPVVRLVEYMLADSDNVVAEALARQVAIARDQPASFEGAAGATEAVVTELGLPADGTTLADGSGLSRTNRISPALLTELLALSADGSRPELAGLFGGLPVAAWSGTLSERFEPGATAGTAAGAGVVRAKTGTLSGVHAISGTVTTADGRLLAFAVLADQVPAGPDQAQPALDRIAATLAGCGCR